jgi:hypothetical protein
MTHQGNTQRSHEPRKGSSNRIIRSTFHAVLVEQVGPAQRRTPRSPAGELK